MITRDPHVSVLMPCYNAANTLGLALASMVAQDYPHWECIVVDDGSDDRPDIVVGKADDSRIKLLRSRVNRGRGASRQLALENAAGEYVCMLDADDWHYPNRLSSQVAVLNANSDLALVSAGMAIVDQAGELQGIRGLPLAGQALTVLPRRNRPRSPRFPYAPSMLRAAVAREYPYDTELTIVEDLDVLVRFTLDHSVGWLSEVLYVYCDDMVDQHETYYESQRGARKVFRKQREEYPVSSRIAVGQTMLKEAIYRTAVVLGRTQHIIDHRSRAASREELTDFQRSKDVISKIAGR